MANISYSDYVVLYKNQPSTNGRYLDHHHAYTEYLIEKLQSQSLTEVILNSGLFNQLDMQAICDELVKNKTVESIKFYYSDTKIIMYWPCLNTILKHVEMHLCYQFENEGAIAIANSIKNLPSLHTLKITLCNINDEGIVALVKSLHEHQNLKVLDLTGNKITSIGINSIIELIHSNTNICNLSVYSTHDVSVVLDTFISESFVIAIVNALRVNTHITKLIFFYFSDSEFTAECNHILRRNRQIASDNIKRWRARRKTDRDAILTKYLSSRESVSQQHRPLSPVGDIEVLIDIIEHQHHLKDNFEKALDKAETDCCLAISKLESSQNELSVDFKIDELEIKRDKHLDALYARYAKYSRLLKQDRTAIEENIESQLSASDSQLSASDSQRQRYKVKCGHAGAAWIHFRFKFNSDIFLE